MLKSKVYTIAQINKYIKNMFAQDFVLHQISLKGEVSNCKYHSSGHIYFTLKDGSSAINVIMFAGNRRGLNFAMKDGDKVLVSGSIEVFERDGKYQLYARKIELDGLGELFIRFEQLKRELDEMGMFAAEYKQPIPLFVKKVGVVTAPTGAAIQDIRNITSRRNPYVQVILYPALVQGEGAASSIVNGIHALEQMDVDVMIVGRGGGSIEDLWAFNEEIVARAIFECPIPVISAVGHETDTTIADYVADLRAPTPSAAAELAVYDLRQFQQQLLARKQMLERLVQQQIADQREKCKRRQMQLKYLNPVYQINEKRKRAADLAEHLKAYMESILNRKQHQLELSAQRLDGLSPLKKLQQGYSVAVDQENHAVKSIRQVQAGDLLTTQVQDGHIISQVTKVVDLSANQEVEQEMA